MSQALQTCMEALVKQESWHDSEDCTQNGQNGGESAGISNPLVTTLSFERKSARPKSGIRQCNSCQ